MLRLKAELGYALARRMFHWSWALRQPRVWRWMEGQYARKAALGDPHAQSFYGHVLLFRGKGFGVRAHALGLLQQAAQAGDGKSAYQLGVEALRGDLENEPDAAAAARWWQQAAEAGHPLALRKLIGLLREGGPGLEADPNLAKQYQLRLDADDE